MSFRSLMYPRNNDMQSTNPNLPEMTRTHSPHTAVSAESLPSHQSDASFHFDNSVPSIASPASDGLRPVEADASLGLASRNFSGLYGLTSDMEPILMVGFQVNLRIAIADYY
jgi:hypothetical protein